MSKFTCNSHDHLLHQVPNGWQKTLTCTSWPITALQYNLCGKWKKIIYSRQKNLVGKVIMFVVGGETDFFAMKNICVLRSSMIVNCMIKIVVQAFFP